MCNCIKSLEQKLWEEYQSHEAFVDSTLSLSGGCSRAIIRAYNIHEKKLDGTPAKRTKDKLIIATFCPFCGKPYDA